MGRRIIAIFVAAVVALIGVTAVLLYARGADQRAVQANQPVDTYIAAKVVPAGTTLKDAVRAGLLDEDDRGCQGPARRGADHGHRQQQFAPGTNRHSAGRVRPVLALWDDSQGRQGDPGPAGHGGDLGAAERPSPGRARS